MTPEIPPPAPGFPLTEAEGWTALGLARGLLPGVTDETARTRAAAYLDALAAAGLYEWVGAEEQARIDPDGRFGGTVGYRVWVLDWDSPELARHLPRQRKARTGRSAAGLSPGTFQAYASHVNDLFRRAYEGSEHGLCPQLRAFEKHKKARGGLGRIRLVLAWVRCPAADGSVAPPTTEALPADARGLREAPRPVGPIFGYARELERLRAGLTGGNRRVILVAGLGGAGKSTLAARVLTPDVTARFVAACWRTLADNPPFEVLCEEVLDEFLRRQAGPLPEPSRRHAALRDRMWAAPCLLVLDNFESILAGNGYAPGREGFGRLIADLARPDHPSRLVLTSRIPPPGWHDLAAKTDAVELIDLTGGLEEAALELLRARELRGDDETLAALAAHCGRNPQVLIHAAVEIRNRFAGDVAAYLRANPAGNIPLRRLIGDQTRRLSPVARRVLDALAVARRPLTPGEVEAALCWDPVAEIRDAVDGLVDRDHLAQRTEGGRLMVQANVQEQHLFNLREEVAADLRAGRWAGRVREVSLLHASGPAHVRETQHRLVLGPILDDLGRTFPDRVAEHLQCVLATAKGTPAHEVQFAGGNLVNLLAAAAGDLNEADLSGLVLRGACFAGARMWGARLDDSDVTESTFADSIGSLWSVAVPGGPAPGLVAAGDGDGFVHLWDLRTLRKAARLAAHHNIVFSLAFDAAGTRLASGSGDSTVALWDRTPGGWQLRARFTGHRRRVRALAFAPHGQELASGSDDGSIRVWHPDGRADPIRVWEVRAVRALAYSPDGTFLAAGGPDGRLTVYAPPAEAPVRVMPTAHAGGVTALAFAPDGRWLLSGGHDGSLTAWDVAGGWGELATRTGAGWVVQSIAGLDAERFATAGDDNCVSLWHLDRVGRTLDPVIRQRTDPGAAHRNIVSGLAAAPALGLLFSASQDRCLRLFAVEGDAIVPRWAAEGSGGRGMAVQWLGGERIVAGADDCAVRVWDAATGRPTGTLHAHQASVWAVAPNRTGTILATGDGAGVVCLHATESGPDPAGWPCVARFRDHTGEVLGGSLTFDPTGRFLASAGVDRVIRIRDLHAPPTHPCAEIVGHGARVWCLDFSPDRRFLVSGDDDGNLFLWDLSNPTGPIRTAGHDQQVWSVRFRPDTGELVSGGRDGFVRVWAVAEDGLQRRGEQQVFPATPMTVTFDRSGWSAAGDDRWTDVRVVSLTNGAAEVHRGHESWIWDVAFAPDGGRVVSVDSAGEMIVWRLGEGPVARLRVPRLYEGLSIRGLRGLPEAERQGLLRLGAESGSR